MGWLLAGLGRPVVLRQDFKPAARRACCLPAMPFGDTSMETRSRITSTSFARKVYAVLYFLQSRNFPELS